MNADLFSGAWDKNIGNVGERTAGHEFGHLLGLRHEDGKAFDLISPPNNRWVSSATNVTSKQLKKIYSNRKFLNRGKNYEYNIKRNYSGNKNMFIKMPKRGIRTNNIKY